MDIVEDLVTSTFTELPEDDHPIVRENACWALDYLAARETEPTLRKRVDEDDLAETR
ncbi:hypothetical protein [Halolamina salifodinae]|uniref:HEAT repeat domain-containing protein n=1 Tax=Halolamina salifodinae TaxID=1202767 RepID=A0A8T4GZ28_9EURY|nr:hypothetical protein [Halolamina salifodinae]MBP1986814.1 hypothetical protein [Halolamina salifodinae]